MVPSPTVLLNLCHTSIVGHIWMVSIPSAPTLIPREWGGWWITSSSARTSLGIILLHGRKNTWMAAYVIIKTGTLSRKEGRRVKALKRLCGTTLSSKWLPVQLGNKDPSILHFLIQPTKQPTFTVYPWSARHRARPWKYSGNKVDTDAWLPALLAGKSVVRETVITPDWDVIRRPGMVKL